MSPQIPATMIYQLRDMAERHRDEPALWTRRGSEWVPTSWRQYAHRVRDFALGLQTLGFAPHQVMAIISFNREEWVVGALGAMAAGGTAAGVYTSSSTDQIEYLLAHSRATVVVVENEASLSLVSSLRGRLPSLQHVIVIDAPASPRPDVLTFAEVLERGARANVADYYSRLEKVAAGDVAQLIYTSGTTGHPKAVMLSHANLCWTASHLALCHPVGPEDRLLSYLPLAHIAEQVCSIYAPLCTGMQVYFAQSLEHLGEDLREVRPTFFFGVPRVWEKFMAKAQLAMAMQSPSRLRAVRWAREIAARYHNDVMAHRQSPISLQVKYALAKQTVLGPLKARVGLDRARVLGTSAAPISREVLQFFASLDLPICEVYGLSESTGPASVSTPSSMKLGKLGRPMPGVEIRIADDGEILIRGGSVSLGYLHDELATNELLKNGWLHSGDVGRLDEDGFLEITGRKKELIVTSGGKKVAPAPLEGMLKAIVPLAQAIVVGDGHNDLVALVTIDKERATAFAAKTGFPAQPEALATHEPFRVYLREAIEREVNAKLAKFETIKEVDVLPDDFSVEGNELTATFKLRRDVVLRKHASRIEALYRRLEAGEK